MTRPWRSCLLGGLLLAAACTDAGSPLSPTPPAPGPDAALQALRCSVSLSSRSMRCGEPAPEMGDARGVIVGGQGLFVRLASGNVSVDGGTLRFDVTVQNLIPQPLGTTDGTSADPGGVRVFFHDGPVALPVGTASVANPDGIATFLASAQPYFQYDDVLDPEETSAPKTWEIEFSPGVQEVRFTVYVAAAVRHEDEWVDVTPGRAFYLPGDTMRMTAVVRDRVGRPTGRTVTWSSSDTSIATVDGTGLVRARKVGMAVINADVFSAEGNVYGGAPAIVVTRETPVSMTVSPESATIDMGERVQLFAQTYNLRGERIDESVVWADGNIWVAVVDPNGRVRGTYPGTTTVMAARGWAQATSKITVRPGPEVQWRGITTGMDFSCAVTTAGKGYCFGRNTAGSLGIGMWNQYGENVGVPLADGRTYAMIDAGLSVSCGLDPIGAAFCWGSGYYGQLGNGEIMTFDPQATPVAVIGGHRFRTLSAGWEHVCAVDLDGKAWCWGNNSYGQLGDGNVSAPFNPQGPRAVLGGLTFARISAGRDFTCGITTDGALYCWGANSVGQLGDGASEPALMVPRPVPVAGRGAWKAVAASSRHACAVTTTGVVHCWGSSTVGELGRGIVADTSDVPVKIASGETFVDVGVGSAHSCAVTEGGTAYCWGYDEDGQLGRGSKDTRLAYPTPEPVIGGVSFAGPIQGGTAHTCALARDGKAWCWGRDFEGEGGIQPDFEFCVVPGGRASCHSQPRPVTNPAASGQRTGPEVGYDGAASSAHLSSPARPRSD